ncbi:hypothetical protein BTHERMOSOX_1684 [Bathymodiolus thermophilus thioautotrophic gill symbiont]|uniref:Uncharacterized protein n=1 Tax=Bathymodiolus thermophilus thioautotrophic gill symbiont TaxID=2360 RepID=A0A1J5TUH8_9GAMM|nr:hypothetical protein [Bathymodiolus thermophilus thioautotrophic gill symbiont]AYQ57407.1 hypothetical protein MS2017_1733 [Bathymodiolus thermophilus thioautotrophic gill symbiont]OIR24472.1 hypothetical protein BGC33_10635 [Bathymodiolus thermophilus thioautotrophic gill symbiont]CAB5495220.1 hypothetical protein THERMOT_267 [Bathymodiolus thermophilus thioautotrophic gill symbiont]CAB5504163.1 hypothetical protein THERMOS_1908 [Bathymodiolus thermophilus thioautotrophic gill symbiont]SGZ
MNKTEFLIGRSGLGLQDDFYPDDLPEDWRFDYYTAIFKTLSLAIDTNEDLEQIFADMKEDEEEEFVLVLTVEESQLTDIETLKELLKIVQGYADDFILFCEVTHAPSAAIMGVLSGYNICFQSLKALKLDLQEVKASGLLLSFNKYPVLYAAKMWDEQEMRSYLESIASVNTKTILICKFAEREALDKMRIISELLGH